MFGAVNKDAIETTWLIAPRKKQTSLKLFFPSSKYVTKHYSASSINKSVAGGLKNVSILANAQANQAFIIGGPKIH